MKNYFKVFKVFEKHYLEIPLETFGSDPYKVLISTLLSARTKDEVTLEASKRLFDKAPYFRSLKQLSNETIQKLIYPVGFYKTKAKHLRELAGSLLTSYGGKVPRTQKELITLPGVGIKTANLVLNRTFHIPAIAVDTHVHRISNILGWVNTKTPEQTEKELVKTLPKKYWTDMNRLFVSIGRQFTSRKKLMEFLTKKN